LSQRMGPAATTTTSKTLMNFGPYTDKTYGQVVGGGGESSGAGGNIKSLLEYVEQVLKDEEENPGSNVERKRFVDWLDSNEGRQFYQKAKASRDQEGQVVQICCKDGCPCCCFCTIQ
jgi:hypothetical protein